MGTTSGARRVTDMDSKEMDRPEGLNNKAMVRKTTETCRGSFFREICMRAIRHHGFVG